MKVRALLFLSAILWLVPAIPARELSEADRADFARCRELQEKGDWLAAREVARELAGRFREGPATRHALVFLNELANLNQRLGSYGAALEQYRFCLDAAVALEGEESRIVAQMKNNLAALHQVLGNFEEAGTLSRAAYATREALEGKGAPATVPAMNNLAGLLWCIGDLAGAEALYREGLRIRESSLGAEALDTARSLANLAGILFYRKEITEAAALAERAVRIFRELAGPTHPDTLEALLFFGDLERAAGRAEVALQQYEEVLEGRVAAFGTRDHVEVAEALRRIGDARRELGRYGGARQAYRESDERYLAVLPERHPDRLEGLYGLGLAALADGDAETARAAAAACAAIEFEQFDAMLAFTNERQRLAYQDIFRSHHLFAGLGDEKALAAFLIRQKGIVSDSLINEVRLSRESTDPAVRALQERLASTRAEFRLAYLGSAEAGRSLEALETEIRDLQEQILRALSPGGALLRFPRPSLEEAQRALGAEEAFLDYFHYERHSGPGGVERRVGLVLLTRDAVEFIDCCDVAEVDAVIAAMIPFFGSGTPGPGADGNAGEVMETLHRLLLAPLGERLASVRSVIVSPEGALSFVPFACLMDTSGRFWIESVDLRYYASARELVRPPLPTGAGGRALLVGNPDFQMNLPGSVPGGDRRGFLSTLRAQDLADMAQAISPLAGAEEEVKRLAPLIAQFPGHEVASLIGPAATETAIRAGMDGARIVHFATHGIYMPGMLAPVSEFPTDSPFVPQEVAGFQNPMFGSWLALAGSGGTLAAWAQGAVPDPDGDGILMANEAADFDLRNTLLVTLSACDTASGEATTGDGVLGLRRGFRLAGAHHVLSTLWPISDAATAVMMQEFYEGLATSDPAGSLSAAQRKWLVQIRDNPAEGAPGPIPAGGMFHAIYLAGPFLMGR